MIQTIDRDDLRRRAMAVQSLNSWPRIRAAEVFGVSPATLARMEQNGNRWAKLAEATVQRLAAGVVRAEAGETNEPAPVIVHEVVETAVDLLPAISRNTGMLNERTHNGQPVYTIADIAEGLGVHFSTVWRHWEERADEFRPGTDVVCIRANGREQPLFLRPGVMLLSMSVGGDQAKAIRVHLRDLENAVHTGQIPGGLSPELSMMAQGMIQLQQLFPQVANQVNVLQQEFAEVRAIAGRAEAATAAMDPEAIKREATKAVAAEMRADIEVCRHLRGQLDALVKVFGSEAEAAGHGPAGPNCTRMNHTIKHKIAGAVPRTAGWSETTYRKAIKYVEWRTGKLTNPNKLDLDGDNIVDFPGGPV